MPVPEGYKPTDTRPESKALRAEDFPLDTKWDLSIADVELEEMPPREGESKRKKLFLSFVGKRLGLILNASNQRFLEERLGNQPNGWIGAKMTLHRTTTLFKGNSVPSLKIIEAHAGTPPTREPGSDDF